MNLDEVIRSMSLMLRRGIPACALVLLTLNWVANPEYQAYAQTACEVDVHFRGGHVAHALPIHVDEDGILVDLLCRDWSGEELPPVDGLRFFTLAQVDSVVVPSKSGGSFGRTFGRTLLGSFFGGLAGTLIGITVGSLLIDGPDAAHDKNSNPTGILIASLVGTVAGVIVGPMLLGAGDSASEDTETVYFLSARSSRAQLRKLCVYPDELPAVLREKLP